MKKNITAVLLIGLIIAVTATIIVYQIADESTVAFENPKIEELIKAELGIQEGGVTDEDILSITSLDIRNQNVSNIEDLSMLSNLSNLDISRNNINDLSPLGELEYIQSLNAAENNIEDLTPLSSMQRINSLNIRDNQISSIDVLEEVDSLISLNISSNFLEEVEGISSLIYLETLEANDNSIQSIEPLENLSYLSEIYVKDNIITDFSILSDLENELQTVEISGNPYKYDESIAYLYEHAVSTDIADPNYRVEASEEGGQYDVPIEVELSSPREDGVIRYTLDGSEPTAGSVHYTEPILISNSIELKAKYFTPDQQSGDTLYLSYIVGEEQAGNLPFISLGVEESALKESSLTSIEGPAAVEKAIRKPERNERKAAFSYFSHSNKNEPAFTNTAGFSSYTIEGEKFYYLRNDSIYGSDSIKYPLYNTMPEQVDHKHFIMRQFEDNMDSIFSELLVDHMMGDIQGIKRNKQFVNVYFNGKNDGIYELSEPYHTEYFRTHYNIKKDYLDLAIDNSIVYGDNKELKDIREELKDLNSYQKQYKYIEEKIDIESLIHYQVMKMYINPADSSELYWRDRSSTDRKWTITLHNVENGFENAEESELMNTWHEHDETASFGDYIFSLALENPEFVELFYQQANDILNNSLSIDNMQKKIKEGTLELTDMEDYQTVSQEELENETNRLMEFAELRPRVLNAEIEALFEHK